MKKIKYILIIAAMLLTGCSHSDGTENVPDAASNTTAYVTETETSESKPAETEMSEVSESESEFTTIVTEEGEHIIYWRDNGTEKSEVWSGYPFPDEIIQNVLGKYFDKESVESIYAADWVINTYYEEVINEAGPERIEYHTAALDLSEGYSACIGEDLLNEVTESIARSLMENYDINSISVSEMRENIIQLENN